MGWTTFHRNKSETIAETLKRHIFGGNLELLDCAVVKRNVAYCAARYTKDGKSYVCAIIVLLTYAPREHHNFGYKDMSEFMGPCESECPKRILDQLTPLEEIAAIDGNGNGTNVEYAAAWRARCVKLAATPTPKPGMKVVFKDAIPFTNGKHLNEFTVTKVRKSLRFENDGLLYRISNWKTRDFQVKEAA